MLIKRKNGFCSDVTKGDSSCNQSEVARTKFRNSDDSKEGYSLLGHFECLTPRWGEGAD
jgi:hypothetical protein